MSDLPESAKSPEGVQKLMASLTFEKPAGYDEPPPKLPPRPGRSSEVMVPRSVRWPLDLDLRVKAAAAARGLTMSQLLRDWAELELAALESDQPVSRADVLRAVAAIRPLGGAA